MKNLLKETLDILKAHGKSNQDVLWVGTREKSRPTEREPRSFSWNEFIAIADFDYDDGFGGNEIARILVIVGTNWWLERGEYDGSEWWEFKTLPDQPPYRSPEKADLMETW